MDLQRSNASTATRVLLKHAYSPLQPDVWRIDGPTGSTVCKSFERRSWILRRTIGVWITAREVRNLRDLEEVEGVPRVVGRPHPWSFEMTFFKAEELPSHKKHHTITTAYFDALEGLLAQIHARGVSHGDLGRRNLMMHSETGTPLLLDFAQSISRRDWPLRPFLSLAMSLDRAKFHVMRRNYLGSGNSDGQPDSADQKPPFLMHFGRFLRRRFYRPLKRWYRGDKQILGRRRSGQDTHE